MFSRSSGRVLSIGAASTADGADAIQWVEINGAEHQWQLVQVS